MNSDLIVLLYITVPVLSIDAPGHTQTLPNLMPIFTTSQNVNLIISRVTRQTTTSVPCCGKEKYSLSAITNHFDGCMEEIGDVQKEDQLPCLYECAGKKLGICDNEGYIIKDQIVEMSELFVDGDEYLQNFLVQVAAKVVDYIKNIPKERRQKTKCNTELISFCHGLYHNMEINCPKDLKNKAEECETLRADMRKKSQPKSG